MTEITPSEYPTNTILSWSSTTVGYLSALVLMTLPSPCSWGLFTHSTSRLPSLLPLLACSQRKNSHLRKLGKWSKMLMGLACVNSIEICYNFGPSNTQWVQCVVNIVKGFQTEESAISSTKYFTVVQPTIFQGLYVGIIDLSTKTEINESYLLGRRSFQSKVCPWVKWTKLDTNEKGRPYYILCL